jgi:hypothetical protein
MTPSQRVRAAAAVLLTASLAMTMSAAAAVPGGPAAPAPAPAAKSAWSIQHVPPLDTHSTISRFLGVSCPTGGSCVGVGWFIGTDGTKRPLAERWDARGWHILAPARPASTLSSTLDLVSCVSPVRCQAIGTRGRSADGKHKAGLIAETWNGRRWRMVPVPRSPGTDLTAMSCATASMCFAVGDRTASSRLQAVSLRWNGTRWSAVQPRRPRAETDLGGVACPGPENCYATGGSRDTASGSPGHLLVEHWNGHRWATQPVRNAPRNAGLSGVSCATGTACTAVGTAAGNSSRLLAADLSKGTWRTSRLADPPQAARGTSHFRYVSCSAPRVCTATLSYIGPGDSLVWATASRGTTGGFRVTVPATDVSQDFPTGISCRAAGCTLVGAKDANSGRGGDSGTGTAFAWRGKDGHFAIQRVPPPPGSKGGRLSKVSCAGNGFCAATTSAPDQRFSVPAGDPSVLVRRSQHGAWRRPANAGHGFLSGISCPSATFCLALGDPGALRWNGQRWATAPAPGHPDPLTSGMQELSCTSRSFCLAVGMSAGSRGKAQYATWNGSTWSPIAAAPAPAGSTLSALTAVDCTAPGFCVAAGVFLKTPTGRARGLIETWNGTKWTLASPQPLVDLTFEGTDVSCATRSACMVNWGSAFEAIARWFNGTTWTVAPYPGPGKPKDNRSVLGVSCPSATSCFAVGTQVIHRSTFIFTQLIEHWNGQRWTVVTPAQPGSGLAQLNDVSCTTPTRCTAVGYNSRLVDIPFAEVRG